MAKSKFFAGHGTTVKLPKKDKLGERGGFNVIRVPKKANTKPKGKFHKI